SRLPSPLLCPTQDKCYSNRALAKHSGLPAREIGRCERALGDALDWASLGRQNARDLFVQCSVFPYPYSCIPWDRQASGSLPQRSCSRRQQGRFLGTQRQGEQDRYVVNLLYGESTFSVLLWGAVASSHESVLGSETQLPKPFIFLCYILLRYSLTFLPRQFRPQDIPNVFLTSSTSAR
ncbi:hypothetical protein R3P38DRAFT_2527304, partial [Favolaschia claudopus]